MYIQFKTLYTMALAVHKRSRNSKKRKEKRKKTVINIREVGVYVVTVIEDQSLHHASGFHQQENRIEEKN